MQKRLKAIHQFLPNFGFGDAIANHNIAIKNYLQKRGYESQIFARDIHPKATQALAFPKHSFKPDHGLLYHHSIGSEITPFAVKHAGPKCMIYHNITPSHFFKPYSLHLAELTEKGRSQELAELIKSFPLTASPSHYNNEELQHFGAKETLLLPIAIDLEKLRIKPNPQLLQSLNDGQKNIIFVGRYAPNKKQDDLILCFNEYLKLDQNARLILVGSGQPGDLYFEKLRYLVEAYQLEAKVILTQHVSDQDLMVYYKTADLFWSMSEHEGFCVPLIEAMWSDIPILAYKSSAIPETLGEGGILFTDKSKPLELAALAKLMLYDEDLRSKILAAQNKKKLDFTPEAVEPYLDQLVTKLEEQA